MAQRSIAETRVAAIETNKRGYLYAHTTANHQWVENPKDEYAAEAMTPGACVVNLSYWDGSTLSYLQEDNGQRRFLWAH